MNLLACFPFFSIFLVFKLVVDVTSCPRSSPGKSCPISLAHFLPWQFFLDGGCFWSLVSRDDFFGVFLPCGLRLDRLSNKLSQPSFLQNKIEPSKNTKIRARTIRTHKRVCENICLYCYSMLYKLWGEDT